MKFTPYRITLIYFAFAVVWVTTTDQLLEWIVDDVALLSQLQTAKGLFYISLTAIGLYLMIKSYERYTERSKKELEAKDKSLNLALNSGKIGTWEYLVEADSYITSSNINELFGKDQGFTLKDLYKKIHPDDFSGFRKETEKILSGSTDFDFQYRIVEDDGTVKWFWTKGEPKMADGVVESVSGITLDITLNKDLQEKLAREKELQKLIFENIPVMITVYRPDIGGLLPLYVADRYEGVEARPFPELSEQ
jgi:PAS domain-containing protein